MDREQNISLYDRLGRADGIRRIVHDVIDAHLANPVVAPRFTTIKDIEHTKKVAAEFFCAGTGGPEPYTGRELLEAHRGMNINEQEYMAVMDDILHSLKKNGVDDVTQGEVTAILYSMKGNILRV